MNCLINILSNEKQKSLINLVHDRDETFEQEIISYKKLFYTVLDYCLDGKFLQEVNDQSQYSSDEFCTTNGCYCSSICSQVYAVIKGKISIDEVERFFNGIQYCYLRWIDAEASVALNAFEALLKEYDLISAVPLCDADEEKKDLIVHNLDKRVFFRARVTSEPDQYLGKMDMFHVPFNKRYNLRNERFSLTGQPILYLGNSIPDILEEMGIDPTDTEALKHTRISSFEFIEPHMRIYDLRSNVEDTLKHSERIFTKQDFFRNLLSYICSFQKRNELNNCAFKEEYAIPQMLTQVLKKNNYHGICYYSTKSFQKYHIPEEMINPIHGGKNLLYRENLAIFTNMVPKGPDTYDWRLFESLEISMPISMCNISKHSMEELDKLLESIQGQNIFPDESDKSDYINKRNDKAESIVKFYHNVFSKMTVNGKPYEETPMGDIHIQLLLGILNRLLVDVEQADKIDLLASTREPKEQDQICMVMTCNIDGDSQGEKDEDTVHRDGILHLARVIFIQSKGENDCLKIATWSKNWNALFYSHSVEIENEMRKKNFDPSVEKKKIGAFIHKKFKMKGRVVNEIGLVEDFEYVDVYLCDAKFLYPDQPVINRGYVWKSRTELKEDLEKYYSSMDSIYQQALPILLKYLKMCEDKKTKGTEVCSNQSPVVCL